MTGTAGRRRVGIAGAGWVSRYHLPAWQRQAARAEVVAIADPDPAARQARQSEFGVPAVYATAEEMIEAEALDILDVCTPRDAHEDLVRLGAAHGCAVMCQKPLAPTLARAKALVDQLPASLRLMVHENWRFRPIYRELGRWLAEGVAGPIRHVRLDFVSSGMIPDATGARPALMRQPFLATLPRLLVSEILIHHLDTLRFLVGEMRLEAASLWRSNSEIIGEDAAVLALRTAAGGAPVQMTGNLAVHGAPPLPRDWLTIYAENSTITLDGGRLIMHGPAARDTAFDDDANYTGGYDGAIAHFVDCLSSGAPFETRPADNLETLALVEAAYEIGGRDRGEP